MWKVSESGDDSILQAQFTYNTVVRSASENKEQVDFT